MSSFLNELKEIRAQLATSRQLNSGACHQEELISLRKKVRLYEAQIAALNAATTSTADFGTLVKAGLRRLIYPGRKQCHEVVVEVGKGGVDAHITDHPIPRRKSSASSSTCSVESIKLKRKGAMIVADEEDRRIEQEDRGIEEEDIMIEEDRVIEEDREIEEEDRVIEEEDRGVFYQDEDEMDYTEMKLRSSAHDLEMSDYVESDQLPTTSLLPATRFSGPPSPDDALTKTSSTELQKEPAYTMLLVEKEGEKEGDNSAAPPTPSKSCSSLQPIHVSTPVIGGMVRAVEVPIYAKVERVFSPPPSTRIRPLSFGESSNCIYTSNNELYRHDVCNTTTRKNCLTSNGSSLEHSSLLESSERPSSFGTSTNTRTSNLSSELSISPERPDTCDPFSPPPKPPRKARTGQRSDTSCSQLSDTSTQDSRGVFSPELHSSPSHFSLPSTSSGAAARLEETSLCNNSSVIEDSIDQEVGEEFFLRGKKKKQSSFKRILSFGIGKKKRSPSECSVSTDGGQKKYEFKHSRHFTVSQERDLSSTSLSGLVSPSSQRTLPLSPSSISVPLIDIALLNELAGTDVIPEESDEEHRKMETLQEEIRMNEAPSNSPPSSDEVPSSSPPSSARPLSDPSIHSFSDPSSSPTHPLPDHDLSSSPTHPLSDHDPSSSPTHPLSDQDLTSGTSSPAAEKRSNRNSASSSGCSSSKSPPGDLDNKEVLDNVFAILDLDKENNEFLNPCEISLDGKSSIDRRAIITDELSRKVEKELEIEEEMDYRIREVTLSPPPITAVPRSKSPTFSEIDIMLCNISADLDMLEI
eukprot:sb/3462177/